MNYPTWLDDLMDEFPTNRSDRAIARLARTYSDHDSAIMDEAVSQYMLSGASFFPKVGELLPFVKEAEHKETVVTVDWREWAASLPDGYREQIDEKLLRWEQARGTMASGDVLEAEHEAAKLEVKKHLSQKELA